MTAQHSFDETEALRHVAADADLEQLRAAVLAVINGADSGGYVDDQVRDLKHLLWTALTTEQIKTLNPDVADPHAEPEIHAVTGTHHKADARVAYLGRRGGRRYVGFQPTNQE